MARDVDGEKLDNFGVNTESAGGGQIQYLIAVGNADKLQISVECTVTWHHIRRNDRPRLAPLYRDEQACKSAPVTVLYSNFCNAG